MTFVFNKNYKDREQIAEFIDGYMAVYNELTAAGQYPYNNSFKGRIPGLAGATDKDEDSAIYMLQTERDLRAMEAKLARYLADGWEPLTEQPAESVKVKGVVEYGFYVGGTGWREWTDPRILPFHSSTAVLPKGKRTNGHMLGSKVLVKR